MQTSKLNQQGLAPLLLVVLVAMVLAAGYVGYKVTQNSKPNSEITSHTVQQIKTKADLNKAASTLDQTALDEDLNPSQLDADIDSLL